MPKDTTEAAEMSKADKAILKRNHACLSCRKRKMKVRTIEATAKERGGELESFC